MKARAARADAVWHEHLDPLGSAVGEEVEVGVALSRSAEDLDDTPEFGVGAGAHIPAAWWTARPGNAA